MSDSLQVAIAGTGRMGRAVEESAHLRGHQISARFDRANPVTMEGLTEDLDVVIDFTEPEVAVSHITHYCRANIPAVIGTTGWYNRFDEVQRFVISHQSAILYSSNYSLGIQLILQALQILGTILDRLPEFDVAIHELHHSAKLDSPSGTAIHLAERLIQNLQRKHNWGEPSSQYDSSKIEIGATRIGHVFGTHRIMIDGPSDHIVLEHTAKSREGFALGAVRAAEWIQGRTGLFTLEDMLADWLQNHD